MSHHNEHKPSVLFIDDEIDLGLIVTPYFEQKEYEVHVCLNIEKTKQAITSIAPTLVFVDNNLPDGSGWDFAPQIAKKFPEAVFFLMSGYNPALPNMPVNTIYYIVEKPISFEQLDQLIETVH